jgi:uncharacterized protein (TIGR02246 family)
VLSAAGEKVMTTATTKASTKDVQAIHGRIEEFVNAWNTHNPRAMSMVYADDADLINPAGRVAKSRAEIERLFTDEHAGLFKESRMAFKAEEIRLLSPDIAIIDEDFEVTGMRDPSGKEMTLRGHLTQALKKEGDTWWVVTSRPMTPMSMTERH